MRSVLSHRAIGAALLAGAAALGACGSKADPAWAGYVEGEYVYVASPIAGALTTLAVQRGDEVKRGAPLFALDFFRRNAPRHVGVLTGLLEQAEREGSLRTMPPLQRFMFMMGSVLMPIVFAAEVFEAAPELKKLRGAFESQVLSDAAIAERVTLALAAICITTQAKRPARRGGTA